MRVTAISIVFAATTVAVAVSLRAQGASAQAAGKARPQFEVASVKPCRSDAVAPGARGGGEGGSVSPGRMTLNCQTVSSLITAAYIIYADGRGDTDPGLVLTTPIEGGPSWIDAERYTIEAVATADANEGLMYGPMLQALLEERFKLRIRRATREVPVYELTVAKGGPKLTPFPEGSCVPPVITFPPTPPPPGQRYCERGGRPGGPNRVLVQEGITLDELCKDFLSGNPVAGLGRRVIDKTGIAGKFNIRLEFAPPPIDPSRRPLAAERQAAAGEPTAPSLVTALQEQLGLKLEPARGPGEFIVIDHVERPSEN